MNLSKPLKLLLKSNYFYSSTTYKTVIGGLMTVTLGIVFIIGSYYLLMQMLSKTKIETTKNEIVIDISQENKDHYIFQNGISVAFTVVTVPSRIPEEDKHKYFVVEPKISISIQDESEGKLGTFPVIVEFEPWNDQNFPFDKFPKSGIRDYLKIWCFKIDNYPLRGNFAAKIYKTIEIYLKRWVNKPECVSKEVFERDMWDSYFQIYIANPYFDFQNIENPVQYYLDDSYYVKINPYLYTRKMLYVQKNEYTAYDDYFNTYTAKKGTFYSLMDRVENTYSPKDVNYFADATFNLSPKINQYERRVFSVIDLTGQIGGIFEIAHLLCALIIGFFSNKLYLFSLVNRLDLSRKKRGQIAKINLNQVQPQDLREDNINKNNNEADALNNEPEQNDKHKKDDFYGLEKKLKEVTFFEKKLKDEEQKSGNKPESDERA